MIVGDFNVKLSMHERSDYFQGMIIAKNVEDFQECMKAISVTDAHSEAPLFTWSNHRRQSDFLARKLDKILSQ